MSHNVSQSEIEPRQQRALEAILAGHTNIEAAAIAGVDRRTVTRWRAQPAFAEALEAARADALDAAETRLRRLLRGALDALETVLADPTAPHAARIRAAELVLARTLDAAGKTAEAAPDPGDVDRILRFMQWEHAQKGAADVAG